jgi:hypothetical protein
MVNRPGCTCFMTIENRGSCLWLSFELFSRKHQSLTSVPTSFRLTHLERSVPVSQRHFKSLKQLRCTAALASHSIDGYASLSAYGKFLLRFRFNGHRVKPWLCMTCHNFGHIRPLVKCCSSFFVYVEQVSVGISSTHSAK